MTDRITDEELADDVRMFAGVAPGHGYNGYIQQLHGYLVAERAEVEELTELLRMERSENAHLAQRVQVLEGNGATLWREARRSIEATEADNERLRDMMKAFGVWDEAVDG